MALQKVTFRARTRGKSPKSFSYEGYGKAVERTVERSGTPIVVDSSGTELDYEWKKDDETKKYSLVGKDAARVKISEDKKSIEFVDSGLSFVYVDDADVEAIVPKKDAGIDAQKAFFKDEILPLFGNDLREVNIAALLAKNAALRDEVAPKSAATKEDDLQEIVALLKEHKVLTSDELETKWRRQVTMGADAQTESTDGKASASEKLDFAYTTALGKKVASYRPKA